MKVKTTTEGRKIFKCPGCDDYHSLRIRPAPSPSWEFNDNHDKPTFKPSILATYDWGDNNHEICHSFVTDGQIQFLGDCTHKLSGQTVEIPEWPHAPGEFGGVVD